MVLRRRPLLRTAAVGAVAAGTVGYVAGKSRGAQAAQQQAAPAQVAPIDQLRGTSSAAAPVPTSQADRVKALTELKGLLDSRAISQDEFARMKKNLLEGT